MSVASKIANALRSNPLLFNASAGGFLCASSDAVAQHLEDRVESDSMESCRNQHNRLQQKSHSYLATSTAASLSTSLHLDWIRVASAGLIGSFFGDVVYPMAYAKLDAIWVGTRFLVVFKKSLVEIATVGIFVNSISMTSRGFLRGDPRFDDCGAAYHPATSYGYQE